MTSRSVRFDELPLASPILNAVLELGFDTPTQIQQEAIPMILGGHDVMAAAQTGTGKTAAFSLPILSQLVDLPAAKPNHCHALILTPTRELAQQVFEAVKTFSKKTRLKAVVAYGGVSINTQMMAMRRGADILIACPGRLLDLETRGAVKLGQVTHLVLDEADRMLDMGFINDIQRITKKMPPKRQNLMFSATFSPEIRALAGDFMTDTQQINIAPQDTTSRNITQWIVPIDSGKKNQALIHMIGANNWTQVLVFCKTKHGANRLADQLSDAGLKASAIHSDKSQGARARALKDFKNGRVRVLTATDIAARGIDINELPIVVNYELPLTPADYVHRIGRTGRAHSEGQAISLVSHDETDRLVSVERLIKQVLELRELEEFPLSRPLVRREGSKGRSNGRPRNKSGSNGPRRDSRGGSGRSEGGYKGNSNSSAPRSEGGYKGNSSNPSRGQGGYKGNSNSSSSRSDGNSRPASSGYQGKPSSGYQGRSGSDNRGSDRPSASAAPSKVDDNFGNSKSYDPNQNASKYKAQRQPRSYSDTQRSFKDDQPADRRSSYQGKKPAGAGGANSSSDRGSKRFDNATGKPTHAGKKPYDSKRSGPARSGSPRSDDNRGNDRGENRGNTRGNSQGNAEQSGYKTFKSRPKPRSDS